MEGPHTQTVYLQTEGGDLGISPVLLQAVNQTLVSAERSETGPSILYIIANIIAITVSYTFYKFYTFYIEYFAKNWRQILKSVGNFFLNRQGIKLCKISEIHLKAAYTLSNIC